MGGGPTGDEARGRMPSRRFPPPTCLAPLRGRSALRASPRWGEVRVLAAPPWTTTRDVLFKKSPKAVTMTMQKDEVLELVRQLPDDVDLEEVIYRLYLREKLAATEADSAAGRTLSSEEVREQAHTWRQ